MARALYHRTTSLGGTTV